MRNCVGAAAPRVEAHSEGGKPVTKCPRSHLLLPPITQRHNNAEDPQFPVVSIPEPFQPLETGGPPKEEARLRHTHAHTLTHYTIYIRSAQRRGFSAVTPPSARLAAVSHTTHQLALASLSSSTPHPSSLPLSPHNVTATCKLPAVWLGIDSAPVSQTHAAPLLRSPSAQRSVVAATLCNSSRA